MRNESDCTGFHQTLTRTLTNLQTAYNQVILYHYNKIQENLSLVAAKVIVCVLVALLFSSCSDGINPVDRVSLDTLSHKYTWTMDTVGAKNSDIIGITAFNDDEIWLSGRFWTADSNGNINWQDVSNIAKWDGLRWEFVRLLVPFNGRDVLILDAALYANSKRDIWYGSSHYNGAVWTSHDLNSISRLGGTNDIWSDGDNETYLVGNNGSIMRFKNNRFEQIGLVTTARNRSVHGVNGVVRVAVRDDNVESGSLGYFVRIENGIVTIEKNVAGMMYDVWGVDGTWYGGGTSPLYINEGYGWREVLPNNGKVILSITGTGRNDVYVIRTGGEVIHFNGSTFETIRSEASGPPIFIGRCIATSNNIYLAARINGYAVLIKGTRSE